MSTLKHKSHDVIPGERGLKPETKYSNEGPGGSCGSTFPFIKGFFYSLTMEYNSSSTCQKKGFFCTVQGMSLTPYAKKQRQVSEDICIHKKGYMWEFQETLTMGFKTKMINCVRNRIYYERGPLI